MSVPVAALDGGAGGNPLDSPGTTPPPGSVTAPLGDTAGGGGGVAADADEGGAPIPFPGEEDDNDDEDGDDADETQDVNTTTETAARGGEEEEEDNVEKSGEDGAAGPSEPKAKGGPGKGKGKGKGGKGAAAASDPTARPPKSSDKTQPPGTCQLPTARVKKIIMSDPDVDSCGKEATFAVGKACEIYINRLVDEAYTQARLDKRKAVVYKDVARAIKNTPHLEFLMDVVPMSMPLSQALAERQRHSDFAAALETAGSAEGLPLDDSLANGAGLADDSDYNMMDDAMQNGARGNGIKADAMHANMELDANGAEQMHTHRLPPLASSSAGDALRERVGSVEDIEDA